MKKEGTIKGIFKFITDVISWTCLCLLILIGGCIVYYVIAAQKYAARGEKYEPYFSLYTIISPSMEPNIKVYDVILDTRVDDVKDIKVGDVITFISTGSLSNGMVITHRVIEVINNGDNIQFRTKGDNNQSPDGALVESKNVLGKTLLRIPQLGRVQFLLASKGGWFICIIIPALGVIIYDIIKLFKVSTLKTKVEGILEDSDQNTDEEDKKKKELEAKRKEELKRKLNLENFDIDKSTFQKEEDEKDIYDELNNEAKGTITKKTNQKSKNHNKKKMQSINK